MSLPHLISRISKCTKLFILSFLMLINFSITKAQGGKTQILDEAFKSAKERYFSFSFESRDQLNQLSKIISIDKVEKDKVYAYASRADFDNFFNTHLDYELLDHPNTFFHAEMFDSKLKKNYAWDQYLMYEDYVDMMYQFANDYPAICQVFSIGKTVEGRELLVAKISDNIDVSEAEPQFFYSGQIHGDELVTSILMLRLIDYLTTNYGADEQVNKLVNGIEIWINPLANPDGLYAGGNTTVNYATRFNANSIDLNRNFPDPEDGEHPDGKSWQTETQHFMNLAEAQHFVMSANTHAGAEVVNYPWDTWTVRHADDNWWQFVSHEYADTAQFYSPIGYMDGFDDGITNGIDWYPINGGRQDYMNYFHHCREFTLEQSTEKHISESQLPDYWDYNRQAMLNYLEQVTYGFNGRITDLETGDPIQAKIEIDGHDFDESFVLSNQDGYYYRPIKAGLYTLNFSADEYESVSKTNQQIADYDSKTINVQLQKLNTGIEENTISKIQITNPVHNHTLHIISSLNIKQIKIYSILGQLIYSSQYNTKELQIDIQNFRPGIYITKLEFSNGEHIQQRFINP